MSASGGRRSARQRGLQTGLCGVYDDALRCGTPARRGIFNTTATRRRAGIDRNAHPRQFRAGDIGPDDNTKESVICVQNRNTVQHIIIACARTPAGRSAPLCDWNGIDIKEWLARYCARWCPAAGLRFRARPGRLGCAC